MRIDSHQHFWIYDPAQYDWISGDMDIMKQDHLPDRLRPELSSIGFDGSVAVQARQSPEETRWLLELADQYEFIKAVVGWVDLRSPDVEETLLTLSAYPKMAGGRHVLHDEKDDGFMLGKDFLRGISCLNKFGVTYDILVFPRHLPNALQLVSLFPEQVFILDHIAKPAIRNKEIREWKKDIEKFSTHGNVYCKLSGMVTEASWHSWKPEDIAPYLDVVFASFGTGRLMIGSDWPVCRLAGTYRQVMEVVLRYIDLLPEAEQDKILGGNAVKAYHLTS